MNHYFMGLRLLECVSDISDKFPGSKKNIENVVNYVISSSKIKNVNEYNKREWELYNQFLVSFFSAVNQDKKSNFYYLAVEAISETLEKMLKIKHD